jgi:outer membrane autotransporter protein
MTETEGSSASHITSLNPQAGDSPVRSRRQLASVEAGVTIPLGSGLRVTPKTSLRYDQFHLDGYQELGNVASLTIQDYDRRTLEGRAGLAVSGSALMHGWTVRPSLEASVVHAISGAGSDLQMRFTAAPDAQIDLPISGGARTWLEARGGLTAERGTLSLQLGMSRSNTYRTGADDRVVASAALRF